MWSGFRPETETQALGDGIACQLHSFE